MVVGPVLASVLSSLLCPGLALGLGNSAVGPALPTGCRMGFVGVVVPALVVAVMVSSVALLAAVSVMVCTRSGSRSNSVEGLVQPTGCRSGCGPVLVVALLVL